MSKLHVLVVVLGVLVLASCGGRSNSARLEGWTVDLVNQSETLGPDGHKDVQITNHVDPGPSITRIQVHNVDGQSSTWDTIPNNATWALGVADRRKPQSLLNSANGSILIPLKEQTDRLLYAEDNGTFRGGQTQFEVVVTREGGQDTTYEVER